MRLCLRWGAEGLDTLDWTKCGTSMLETDEAPLQNLLRGNSCLLVWSHCHRLLCRPFSNLFRNIYVEMSATKLKCCVGQERGVDSSTFIEEDDSEEESVTMKTYRRYWIRWLMLLALFILNTSNGMVSGVSV